MIDLLGCLGSLLFSSLAVCGLPWGMHRSRAMLIFNYLSLQAYLTLSERQPGHLHLHLCTVYSAMEFME